VRRDNRAGYKAGALAEGLARSDAPFVAMLDADFRAPRDWLRRAVPVLLTDPRAAFCQQRCDFRSAEDNALTRVQQLMQDAHYMVEQAARHGRNVPMQANGTATVWRRAAIDDAGGWSGETLTEDLDLTLRCYLRGWHAALLLEPPCVGEMPADMRDFQTQQSRWSSGFLQVARKLLPQVWGSALPAEAKFSTSLLILMQLFFPCIVLLAIATAIDIVLVGGVAHLLRPALVGAGLALVLMVAMTLPPYLALRRGTVSRYVATLASLPVFMVRLGFVNAFEILTASLGRQRAFAVTPKQGKGV
jgi:cellulose synthase/poly-beta-1,6-N-acetylglucosamine synthase-like glycosyltransferase